MKYKFSALTGMMILSCWTMPYGFAQQLNPTPYDYPSCAPLLPSLDEIYGYVHRVSLDGLLVEETTPETGDADSGDKYIDSLNGRLRYESIDLRRPLPEGELALVVNRMTMPEKWAQDARSVHGQHPQDHVGVDRPFGMCWSSGIGASLCITSYYVLEQGTCPTPLPSSHVRASDETGTFYGFTRNPVNQDTSNIPAGMDVEEALDKGIISSSFQAIPSNELMATGLSEIMQRNEGLDGDYILTRKSGTQIRYEGAPSRTVIVSMDKDGKRLKVMRYHRLLSVADLSDRTLTYQYAPKEANGSGTLIPSKIIVTDPSQDPENQQSPMEISIQMGLNDLITNITDSSGQIWQYQYQEKTIGAFDLPFLTKVISPVTGEEEFEYDTSFINIPDDAPRSYGDTTPAQNFSHLLLKEVKTNTLPAQFTRFNYKLDDTVRIPALVKVNNVYTAVTYTSRSVRPPILTAVQTASGTANFDLQGPVSVDAEVDGISGLLSNLTLDGSRTMTVTGIDGSVRSIQYNYPKIIKGVDSDDAIEYLSTSRSLFYNVLWRDSYVNTPDAIDQDVDTDENGISDSWEMMYFGQIGVDPDADPDGDGLTNLEEFQNESNPNTSDRIEEESPEFAEQGEGASPTSLAITGTQSNDYEYDKMGRLSEADGISNDFDEEGNLENSN